MHPSKIMGLLALTVAVSLGSALVIAEPVLIPEGDNFVIERAATNAAPEGKPAPVAPPQPEVKPVLQADRLIQASNAPALHLWQSDNQVMVPARSTAYEAIEHVFKQLDKLVLSCEWVPTNVLARMKSNAAAFATEKPVDWRAAMEEILRPYDLAFMEDGSIVRIGPPDTVELHQARLQDDQLKRNHKKIELNSAGGMPLYTVLRMIQTEAGLSMNFDYLSPEDRGVVQEQKLTADNVSKPQPTGKLSTYQTPEGQKIEWRTVLREVLDPFNYDFLEIDGTVRPMSKTMVAQQQKDRVDAKPMVVKVVRLYHADPKLIVDRLKAMPDLLKHSKAGIEVAQGWDSNSRRYAGTMSSLQAGEGTQLGAAQASGMKFNALDRPSTPPSVLIRDVEDNIPAIEARIKSLDKAERQIVIEARILDLGKNADRALGVNYAKFGGSGSFKPSLTSTYSKDMAGNRTTTDVANKNSGSSQSAAWDSTTGTTGSRGANAGASSSSLNVITNVTTRLSDLLYKQVAVLNPLEMAATWDAIQQAGDSKVISQPMIVVGDHCEAVIQAATLRPISVSSTTYPNGNGGSTSANAQPVTTYSWQILSIGITLWVKPEICDDGKQIRLSVHPSISEPTGDNVIAGDGTSYPVITSRELDTRVSVPDGNTLLLGGLLKSDSGFVERKVPLLGDIPFIGYLFKWRSQSKDRQNLILMITPTVLNEEKPNTGYEKPTLESSDPDLSTMGRNLKASDFDELNTKIDKPASVKK